MNNEGNTGKVVTSILASAVSGGASTIETLETFFRISGAALSTVAGAIAIWFAVADRLEKRKQKKHKKHEKTN